MNDTLGIVEETLEVGGHEGCPTSNISKWETEGTK